MKTKNCTAVFDIGKTHVKITIVNAAGQSEYQARTANTSLQSHAPYRHFDVKNIWSWFCEKLTQTAKSFEIKTISIATHGAAAGLVDQRTQNLILPIMDYECPHPKDISKKYQDLRPNFETTGSPALPDGLNLGAQLYWQSTLLNETQKQNTVLLLYPQYWAWRLTGNTSSEITSLGCHTDLWDVHTNSPSPVLERIGLGDSLPDLCAAWEPIGTVKPELCQSIGLPDDCRVLPGVHDSNAGYLPYLLTPKSIRPTVISTGTWSIIMDSNADIQSLDPSRDMLINLDADGNALSTARFMGGREFSLICEFLNTDIATTFLDQDIQDIINQNALILPSFCSDTGPYPHQKPEVQNTKINGKAAATLYAALMLNDVLERLTPNSERDIVIEGSFAGNDVLCGVLAALNPKRPLYKEQNGNSVTTGCYQLSQWKALQSQKCGNRAKRHAIIPHTAKGLDQYAKLWSATVKNRADPAP